MRKFLTPLLLLVGLLLAACETTGNTPPTTESYTVSGTVLDASNNPIPGVEISFSDSTLITRTDADGAWQSPELTSSVTVTPSLAGYVFTPVNQEVHEAADDVNFTGVPTYTFTVVITDEDADPIPGVSLTVELEDGRELRGVETDRDGRWELEGVVGAVTVTPTDPAYTFHYEEDTATADRTELSFEGEMHRCNRVTTRDGTDWCVITRIKQLQDAQLDGHYELGADIDASATRDWDVGKGFLPIGDGEYVSGDYPGAFTGKLDGAGKAISGLFIARPGEENVGLFAVLGKGSEVRELSLSGVDVTGGSAVGALAGRLFGSVHNTVVEGVEVDGRVRGEGVAGSEVGGLVGTAHESIITRSLSAAEVEGSDSVGGWWGEASAIRFGTRTPVAASAASTTLVASLAALRVRDTPSSSAPTALPTCTRDRARAAPRRTSAGS